MFNPSLTITRMTSQGMGQRPMCWSLENC